MAQLRPGRFCDMLHCDTDATPGAAVKITTDILHAAQLARAASLPERAGAAPVRTAILEGVQQRNAVLDALFYDIKVVSEAEAQAISPGIAGEGAILIVPPPGAGDITLCPGPEHFIRSGGKGVTTLTVAGVGSCALGSAAFARNVAAAVGAPVAAVVSGYGLADLATEAFGGFFWFGGLSGLRGMFEAFDTASRPAAPREPGGSGAEDVLIRRSLDTQTVLALLERKDIAFDLLVGHSKGNLVISEALNALRRKDEARLRRLAAAAKVVTISARVALPPAFQNVVDVMGEWDWFGRLNSRPGVPAGIVAPRAWHHTNTDLPAHLDVAAVVRQALAR